MISDHGIAAESHTSSETAVKSAQHDPFAHPVAESSSAPSSGLLTNAATSVPAHPVSDPFRYQPQESSAHAAQEPFVQTQNAEAATADSSPETPPTAEHLPHHSSVVHGHVDTSQPIRSDKTDYSGRSSGIDHRINTVIAFVEPYAQRVGISRDRLDQFTNRATTAARTIQAAIQSRMQRQEKGDEALPAWNDAIAQKSKNFRKRDARAFLLVFGLFFGSFVWLYFLYQLHHKDAVKEHTAIVDFNNAPTNHRLFTNNQVAQPESTTQTVVVQPTGEQPTSFDPAMFGSPRMEGGASTSTNTAPPVYPGAYSPAGYAAPGYQSNPPTAAASYSPYAPYGAPGGINSAQAMVPPGFDSTTVLVGPRTLRHAVGAPLGYTPTSNGRQRTVVNR